MPSRSLQLTVAVALFVTSGAMAFAQTTPDASSMARMQQMRAKIAERFAAADADHDGKLTRDEAKSKMPMVSKEFDAIDKSHKGYVTLDDIHAFARERMQQHAQSAHASASASK